MSEFTQCTFCGSRSLEDGPRGGSTVNMTCGGCGARFNVHCFGSGPRFDGPEMHVLDEILSGPAEDETAVPATIRALRAVLLFYSVWDEQAAKRWERLTGSREATTKALCDTVRAALGGESLEYRDRAEQAEEALQVIYHRILDTLAEEWVAPNPRASERCSMAQYPGGLAEFILMTLNEREGS